MNSVRRPEVSQGSGRSDVVSALDMAALVDKEDGHDSSHVPQPAGDHGEEYGDAGSSDEPHHATDDRQVDGEATDIGLPMNSKMPKDSFLQVKISYEFSVLSWSWILSAPQRGVSLLRLQI